MTPSEYAAIGRRVAECNAKSMPDLWRTHIARDRAALWELCERLINRKVWQDKSGLWRCGYVHQYPSRKTAVAALLESLGGTDG